MGWTSSPRILAEVPRPLLQRLRALRSRCALYVDDLLIMAASREEALRAIAVAIRLLSVVGFIVNFVKSTVVPTQEITYLGE